VPQELGPRLPSFELSNNDSWLAEQVAAGDIERVGPTPPISTSECRAGTNPPPRRG
jgi:hypothetical protein